MISYDAINDVPMSIHPYINSELKNVDKLNFEGFVISDYDSVIKTAT
jgi:beta-glucosidase-like glycosyl hydrolase